jgi:hypothetical protein
LLSPTSARQDGGPCCPALLQTCRQIYEEASEEVWKKSRLLVTVGHPLNPGIRLLHTHLNQNSSVEKFAAILQRVKKLSVSIYLLGPPGTEHWQGHILKINLVVDALKLSPVRDILIEVHDHIGRVVWDPERHYERLVLGPFRALRRYEKAEVKWLFNSRRPVDAREASFPDYPPQDLARIVEELDDLEKSIVDDSANEAAFPFAERYRNLCRWADQANMPAWNTSEAARPCTEYTGLRLALSDVLANIDNAFNPRTEWAELRMRLFDHLENRDQEGFESAEAELLQLLRD